MVTGYHRQKPSIFARFDYMLRLSVIVAYESMFARLFVLISSRLLGKPFIAVLALVRPFTSMDSLVCYHVRTLYKALTTKSKKKKKAYF
jgi:hypothetical protein